MKPEEFASYHKLVFRVAYDFLNAHFPPGNDPEWWEQLSKDVAHTGTEYGGGELLIGMLVAIMDYLDAIYKERRKKNGEA
jgi:hypothetical protein